MLIARLLLMREEEKLAGDVYTALFAIWNVPIFQNIARSESTRMEAMGELRTRHEIDDPVVADEPRVFANPEPPEPLWRVGGDRSRVALDIYDLQQLVRASDNDNLRIVYQT